MAESTPGIHRLTSPFTAKVAVGFHHETIFTSEVSDREMRQRVQWETAVLSPGPGLTSVGFGKRWLL
jgi:hypothetical protein